MKKTVYYITEPCGSDSRIRPGTLSGSMEELEGHMRRIIYPAAAGLAGQPLRDAFVRWCAYQQDMIPDEVRAYAAETLEFPDEPVRTVYTLLQRCAPSPVQLEHFASFEALARRVKQLIGANLEADIPRAELLQMFELWAMSQRHTGTGTAWGIREEPINE